MHKDNRLLVETEGKYSGYKHHPDYEVGQDVRKHPKTYKAKSMALTGKKLGDARVAAGMSRKEPKYLKNTCKTCGQPQIGLHHHETKRPYGKGDFKHSANWSGRDSLL